MGRFTHELDPLAARTYTLVAGGSGITPIYSIAATILDAEPDSIVTLLQVDQATSTIMLLDDIEDLRNRHLDRFRCGASSLVSRRHSVCSTAVRVSSRSSPASSGACSRLLPIMSSSAAPRP